MSGSLGNTVVRRVCACVGVVLVLAAALDYWIVNARVNDMADARLAQSARIINRLVDLSPDGKALRIPSGALPEISGRLLPHSSESQLGFEIWSNANALVASSDVIRGMALDAAPPGFADVLIENRRWRLFTLLGDEGRWVRVGESYDNRNAIDHILLFSGLSSLLVIPLLGFLMQGAVWTSIRPVKRLAEQLAAWRPHQLEPIGGDVPSELVPIVASINTLLRRVNQTRP